MARAQRAMLEVIARGANKGKTERCIELAAEHDAYIVCPMRVDALRIVRMAEAMGLNIRFPLTVYEFWSGQYCGKNIRGFIFDDVDRILAAVSKTVPILGVSITLEEPGCLSS